MRNRNENLGDQRRIAIGDPGLPQISPESGFRLDTLMTGPKLLDSPLLTVAVPTYNRASYLEQNLAQLRSSMAGVAPGLVEIIVSDNCSADTTPLIVENAIRVGLPVRYVRNPMNVGWARNFVQCFDLARGKYVLMMGDDDVFVDGALSLLLSRLAGREYGVALLRPYGYDADYRKEFPGGRGRERVFRDPGKFLIAIGRFMTLTSACVINKSLLRGVNSAENVNADLATFHLMLKASLAAPENLFLDRYLLASKRQNSFGYDFAEVFVHQFWRIIDAHVPLGLTWQTIRRLERDKLFSYYPLYMLDLRASGRGDLNVTYNVFASRFRGRWLFTFWVAPILLLPSPLALLWGGATTFAGRLLGGEFRRGLRFAWSRLVLRLSRRGTATHNELGEAAR